MVIAMLNWNRPEFLKPTLYFALKNTTQNVIIFDDCSDDRETIEYLGYVETEWKRVKVVRKERHEGLPKLLKSVFETIEDKEFILMSNDIIIGIDNWDKALLNYRFLPKWGQIGFCIDERLNVLIMETNVTPIPPILHRRECYFDIGGYNEDLIDGGEDADFSMRIVDKGWKIYGVVIPKHLWFHIGEGHGFIKMRGK